MIAYGYGRASTLKQKGKMTRKDQELFCISYFQTKLKDEGYEWGGFYYDEAKSGGTVFSERDKGFVLYHLLQRGDFLMCSEMSRMFRNKIDGLTCLEDLDKRGVLKYIGDMGDMSGMHGNEVISEYVEYQLIGLAHMQRKLLSKSMMEKFARLEEAGIPHSRSAPIGWKIVGEGLNKRYRVDNNERYHVDHMNKLSLKGYSNAQIAVENYSHEVEKEFKPKAGRGFTDEHYVDWALQARAVGYPRKYTSYKKWRRAWLAGDIKDCHALPAEASQ